jgi:hypothetical protein
MKMGNLLITMPSNRSTQAVLIFLTTTLAIASPRDSALGPIIREITTAHDVINALQVQQVQYNANLALSRYHHEVYAWEKGRVISASRKDYRYSHAVGGGSAIWFQASGSGSQITASNKPFLIDSYQNRNYAFFYNTGRLKNGLEIYASCVFQAWASEARIVGNVASMSYNPTGPWERVLGYQATSKINSSSPPDENGEKTIGQTQSEYRKVPFLLVGSTFFTLPGQNRHFGTLMQLLAYDPTMIPGLFGWRGGIEQSITVVPDPSLKESQLPQPSPNKTPGQSTPGSSDQ